MSPLEITACLLSLAGVYLTAKQRVIAWPIGAIAVALYVWIFFQVRLYADAFLNAIYVILQLYGWWAWTKGADHGKNLLPVQQITKRDAALWLLGAGITGYVIAVLLKTYTNQDYAHLDAAILTFSLVAQYWMARKILACWALWIAIDAVASGVYFAKGLQLTAVLYLLFLGLAAMGHRDWQGERLARA